MCGLIQAWQCGSGLPQVFGEAIGEVQWTDLDKICRSVRLEAQQTPEKHTGYPKSLKCMCPRLALVRFYSSVAVRKRFAPSLWRSFSRGPMDRSRRDLPICKTGSATSTARFLFSGIPKQLAGDRHALYKDKRTLTVGGGKKCPRIFNKKIKLT